MLPGLPSYLLLVLSRSDLIFILPKAAKIFTEKVIPLGTHELNWTDSCFCFSHLLCVSLSYTHTHTHTQIVPNVKLFSTRQLLFWLWTVNSTGGNLPATCKIPPLLRSPYWRERVDLCYLDLSLTGSLAHFLRMRILFCTFRNVS